jgi:hypothetical protein
LLYELFRYTNIRDNPVATARYLGAPGLYGAEFYEFYSPIINSRPLNPARMTSVGRALIPINPDFYWVRKGDFPDNGIYT